MELDAKQITQQMQNFDSRLERLEESQERGFERVHEALKDLKSHKGETESELLGNEKYNRPGIVQMVKTNKDDIDDLKDFKKKILQLVSLIGAGISFLANALIYFLSNL